MIFTLKDNSNYSETGDDRYTPVNAVMPLLPYIPDGSTIWCPFDSENSAFKEVFEQTGMQVITSHIREGKDFFTYEPEVPYDMIISNPPFSLKDKILQRLYYLDKPFALLLPLNALSSQSRVRMYREYGAEVMIFDRRVNYHPDEERKIPGGSCYFPSVYVCHNFLPQQMVFSELPA